MPKVTFTREKKTVECEEGEKLRNVAIANEIELYPGMKRYFNCRGFGQCGECRVHVTKGMENPAPKIFPARSEEHTSEHPSPTKPVCPRPL